MSGQATRAGASRPRAAALSLALAAIAAAACARGAAAWGAKAPEGALLDWLRSKGGESHAVIDTRAGKVRTTWAAKDFKMHDVMAKIPMTAAIWFPHDYSDFADLGVIVAKEALRQDSPWGPYLAALPMLKEWTHTTSFETFPVEYVHLILNELMAHHITSTQSGTLDYWSKHGVDLLEAGVTLDRLRAALVTVATRYFGITHKGVTTSVMIPLLDFANHHDNCTNYYEYLPCSYTDSPEDRKAEEAGNFSPDSVDREDLCCFWFAGEDFKTGDELCNRYGYMAPDQAFFQYGFNLMESPPDMSRVDQAYFTNEHIYGTLAHTEPTNFEGHIEALRDESKRLSERLALLQRAAAAEAATPVAPTDGGGRVLAGLKTLRRQRIEAIERELARLAQEIENKAAAGAPRVHVSGSGGEESSSSEASERTEL